MEINIKDIFYDVNTDSAATFLGLEPTRSKRLHTIIIESVKAQADLGILHPSKITAFVFETMALQSDTQKLNTQELMYVSIMVTSEIKRLRHESIVPPEFEEPVLQVVQVLKMLRDTGSAAPIVIQLSAKKKSISFHDLLRDMLNDKFDSLDDLPDDDDDH